MKNFKVVLEYDGTNYHGWQVQTNAISIQEIIEKALETLLREKVRTYVSGRTDSGVHAKNQVINFKVSTMNMKPEKLMVGLNCLLPEDVAIKNVEEVPIDFDSRKSARSKIYRYVILNRKAPTALERHRCWHVRAKLDVDLMNSCAGYLVGEHDFSSFRGTRCNASHAVRKVFRAAFTAQEDDFIHFEIEGRGFLKHMVRNIVGTLVDVGMGKTTLTEFKSIIDAKDRKVAGLNAPPQGLFLQAVNY